MYQLGIVRAVWGDLRMRYVGWICWKMAVFYWVENQAGERVGVENHPGSGYSGRQCRPLKGIVRDEIWENGCGLGLKMREYVVGWIQGKVDCKEKMIGVAHKYVIG